MTQASQFSDRPLPPDLLLRHNRFRLFVGAASLILIVVLAVSIALVQLHRQAEMRAYAIAQDLSQSLELSISGIIDTIDLALQVAVDDIEQNIAANRKKKSPLGSLLQRQEKRLFHAVQIRATNRSGDVIYGTDIAPPFINVSDRAHFGYLRDHPHAGLHITPPVISRINGKWVWIFARRINRQGGTFGGVVYATLPLAEICKMFSQIKLDPQSAITFRDKDLNLVLRHVAPNTTYWPSDDKGSLALFKASLSKHPDAGSYYNPTPPIDGVSRLYSYHRSPAYQFTINVGVFKDVAFANWRRQAWIVGLLVLVFVLAAAGFVVAISHTWRRKEKVMGALHKSQRFLQEAQRIANLGQYQYDLRADRWKSSRILDEIFGIDKDFPRDAKGWSELVAADCREEMVEYLNKIVKEHLSFDREYRIVRHNDGQERWVHGKGVLHFDENGIPIILTGTIQDISERKQHEAQLEYIAYYDVLTKLPNRRLLTERVNKAQARSKHNHSMIAVCYLDLDDFKPINDRYGHTFGDRVLVAVSQRIGQTLRADDTLARFGGDEFVLLLTGISQVESVHIILERVLETVRRPIHIDGTSIGLTASIGVTLYPDDHVDADTLMRHADQAMYRAKEDGKNGYRIFDQTHDQRVQERLYYLQRLQQALDEKEFVLHYQPKVDMTTGEVFGAEALIRWNHPERGLLSPCVFLPHLERSNLEVAVGEWVINSALRQMAAWQEMGLSISVSVNISPAHLLRTDFSNSLDRLLKNNLNVDPAKLELEILETAMLSDMSHAVKTLEDCRQLGVQLSLDDFGTGYSSLSYFRSLPVQTLKIDQSFVIDMLDNPADLNIVKSVVQLAKTFDRSVIAEGAETLAHASKLMKLGCRLMQGYGIARPMPPEQMPQWHAQWKNEAVWEKMDSAF
ncbi:MAG: EAL domain-containing protein [Oxalobacter sp.]|nr:MAG: EAL domain-containing protein [Oxalobacter sp.]